MFLRTKNSRCLAIALTFIIFILDICLVSASIRINEVMPRTPKAIYTENCEWIEIFSDELVELTNLKIDTTGRYQEFTFNYTMEDFLIITKNKQAFLKNWQVQEDKIIEAKNLGLNDKGDSISLTNKEGDNIDSFTYSSSSNDKSWQFINDWQQCWPTPIEENFCETQEKNEESEEQESEDTKKEQTTETGQETKDKDNEDKESKTSKMIGQDVKKIKESLEEGDEKGKKSQEIKLNSEPKDIKKQNLYISNNEKIKTLAIYGFSVLCLLIVLLFLFKINKS